MYGPPNDNNLQALIKTGAHFIGRLENCFRVLSIPALHRIPAYYRYRSASRQSGKDLAKLLTHLPRILLRQSSAPKGSVVPVTLEPVERFDSEFDRLFEQCAAGYRILGVRDLQYLNWRYLARAPPTTGPLRGEVFRQTDRDGCARGLSRSR